MTIKAFVLTASSLIIGLCVSQPSYARDQALLSQALENSTAERSGVEKNFKAGESSARKPDRESLRAIPVEIGDELGAGGGGSAQNDVYDKTVDHRGFREKGVSKKLDREWKEVNKSFKKVEAPTASSAGGRI